MQSCSTGFVHGRRLLHAFSASWKVSSMKSCKWISYKSLYSTTCLYWAVEATYVTMQPEEVRECRLFSALMCLALGKKSIEQLHPSTLVLRCLASGLPPRGARLCACWVGISGVLFVACSSWQLSNVLHSNLQLRQLLFVVTQYIQNYKLWTYNRFSVHHICVQLTHACSLVFSSPRQRWEMTQKVMWFACMLVSYPDPPTGREVLVTQI